MSTAVAREETRDLTINQALDLGVEMAMAGQHDSAIGLFRGVLMHEPENFEAIERLGASLFESKRHHEALYWFWRGRKLDRKHPMALTNYGLTVCQLGHHTEGLVELQKAVYQAERRPDLSAHSKALCYNNLGNTLEKLKRYDEALIALDKGLAYSPNDGFPHYNRGVVLMRLNRHQEGIAALERALTINPNDADAHYNRGMARLLSGDLKGGFEDYEYRLISSENTAPNLGMPAATKWTGQQSLAGKRLLVHCEQGIGDDIHFLRFVPLLKHLHNPAEILVISHSATAPFFAAMDGVTVLPTGAQLKDRYDSWVALMSLPLCLGIEEATIPAPWAPQIESARELKWAQTLDLPLAGLNIGICWAGNFQHKNDLHRSIPLQKFGRLFDVPGCNFISLQQMRPEDLETFAKLKQKHPNLRAFHFDDLRDTAAAMLNLDLVISVDTAVAHLSATLGVATSILVPAFGTDWRWQTGREDSPWYPAARLYRQPKVGDWDSVIAALRAELAAKATQQRAA